MRRLPLGPGPEFERIQAFVEAVAAPPPSEVVLGPGDDATLLRPASDAAILISTDLSVEEVHFRREWLTWEAIGYRAVAAAVSDLAAMAARPVGALVSLAVPPETDERTLREIGRGVGDCLRSHDAGLLGGDLARSPGPVAIDVVVVGEARNAIGREGARPGDELWVTGDLGGAAAAAAAWTAGLEPHPMARERFERPRPRTAEAKWLVQRADIHAMIDLSDGLGGDAGHLAEASQVALEIRPDLVPLHPTLETWSDREAALGLATAGGEDYELLVAASPRSLQECRAAFERDTDVGLTRIGRAVEGTGVRWVAANGLTARPPGRAFDHFR